MILQDSARQNGEFPTFEIEVLEAYWECSPEKVEQEIRMLYAIIRSLQGLGDKDLKVFDEIPLVRRFQR